MVTAVQATNCYSFRLDAKIEIRPLLAGKAKSFPSPTALIPLLFHPGLRNREKPAAEREPVRRGGTPHGPSRSGVQDDHL
jgi:hypothetical protein